MASSGWHVTWLTPVALDWILIGVGLEFLMIGSFLAARAALEWALPVFFYLASGALLLFAVRLALSQAGPDLLATILASSFVTHLLSLWLLKRRVLDVSTSDRPRDPEL